MSLDEISPHLPRAVITSEDARFCEHRGVDWTEFQGVIEDALEAGEAPLRGASTIPMQTAKNLFLWDGRFAIRKVLELPVALWMDLVWSKRRMIEIYLNIVEWAPGVYGAEAAARHHFKKSARKPHTEGGGAAGGRAAQPHQAQRWKALQGGPVHRQPDPGADGGNGPLSRLPWALSAGYKPPQLEWRGQFPAPHFTMEFYRWPFHARKCPRAASACAGPATSSADRDLGRGQEVG